MKKKKIAICLRDMQIGGVESVCIKMLESLLKLDEFEFVFITYVKLTEPRYIEWFKQHPDIKRYTLYPSKIFGTKLAHFFLWRLAQHMMRDIYRWFRRMRIKENVFPDIDVFVDFYDFSFEREFRNIRRPKIAWWHSSINKFISGNYIRFMPNYDKLVLLTDDAVDEFRQQYREYSNKVVRIYNPVDISDIRTRSTAKVDVSGDYFCVVARLSADKDIVTILRAFDMFWNKSGRPDVRLVIVGGGDMADDLKSIAHTMSSASRIVFAGMQSNPFAYMRGAMAHILSSYNEGLGLVVVEALAAGCVNIASDCKNGPREILMDGRIGLLFGPGDVVALANHMNTVWKKRDMGYDAHDIENSLARFDTNNVAADIERLFNNISKIKTA